MSRYHYRDRQLTFLEPLFSGLLRPSEWFQLNDLARFFVKVKISLSSYVPFNAAMVTLLEEEVHRGSLICSFDHDFWTLSQSLKDDQTTIGPNTREMASRYTIFETVSAIRRTLGASWRIYVRAAVAEIPGERFLWTGCRETRCWEKRTRRRNEGVKGERDFQSAGPRHGRSAACRGILSLPLDTCSWRVEREWRDK